MYQFMLKVRQEEFKPKFRNSNPDINNKDKHTSTNKSQICLFLTVNQEE